MIGTALWIIVGTSYYTYLCVKVGPKKANEKIKEKYRILRNRSKRKYCIGRVVIRKRLRVLYPFMYRYFFLF